MRYSTKRLHLVYLVFGLALGSYLLSVFSCADSGDPEQGTDLRGQYLGEQACIECHRQAFEDWRGSHHDLAMQEARPGTVLGNFDGAVFESNGVTARFFRKDDQFFVNTEGPDGVYGDFQIAYTFGVDPLQQYLIPFPGGRYQCLPIAWDTRAGKWFDLRPDQRFDPDDWLHWTRGSMTWNTMCADCHSTYLRKNYDPEKDVFDTKWALIDVSCEACHGPGKAHVAYVRSSAYSQGVRVEGAYQELTTGLNNREQVGECARCHSLRAVQSPVFDHTGNLLDHYLPELPRPSLYFPDGQIREEVYVYGSFLQSKMYHRDVKCTSCHQPHTLKLKFLDNALCTQCHEPSQFDTPAHHFHTQGTEAALCKNCHMPGRYYMVNDFRRDHSFRVPRPDLSEQYDTPNACNDCHAGKGAAWAAAAIRRWYGPVRKPHFSESLAAAFNGEAQALPGLMEMVGDTARPEIIQATAVWLLGQSGDPAAATKILTSLQHPDALVRHAAVRAAENFSVDDRIRYLRPLLEDSVKAVRAQAAYALADIPRQLFPAATLPVLDRAQADFLSVMDVQADFPTGRLVRGQYFHRKGNLEEAEKSYRQAIRQDPYLAQPHMNLARLYYQQARMVEAEEEFRVATRIDSVNAEPFYELGLLLAEQQRLADAAVNLQQAAELSGNPRYFYNWGLALQHLNRPADAERVFLRALTLAPDFAPNIYALAVLYVQQGKSAAARPLIGKLLQLDPGNPQYRQLLNAL